MKIALIFLSSAMLLLSGINPYLLVQPASAVIPTPLPLGTTFGPTIYKIMVHVNGADKGSISPYYHTYVSGYKENGYDQILFNMDHNLLEITGEEPYFGSFENLRPWITESTSSTVPGQYLIEQSRAQHIDGNNSLHVKASALGAAFGSAGMFQNMLWEISPVAANLNLKFSIYPVSLQSTTASPDSLIIVELDFNYYDSDTTVPKMFLVLQDNPAEALSTETLFINSTNNVYYVLNKQTSLQSGAWNNFNLNITNLATQYYGQNKALNLKINGLHINAYSRNNAVSEFYSDAVQLTSSNTAEQTYSILSNLIKSYDTPELRTTSGEKLDLPSALLYFNTNTYLRPSGSGVAGEKQVIETIHSKGDYVFLSKPDEGSYRDYALNNLWNVDGIAVYSTHNEKMGFAMDIWDHYLSKGVLAMGIAEEHPMSTTDVKFSATTAPTQYVYTDNNSTTTTVEAMAQGRGFVEAGYIRPTMPIFLSAENQQIPMGKFPIYIDSHRTTATLNINLQNIPFVAKTLRVVRNGTTINTISLQGLTSYNTTLTPTIPDKSNYFRLEILNGNGTIIAFSNPIVYVKTDIPSDMWLALTPTLQYGSATSSISSIKYGSNGKLSFTATSRENILVTTKVFTSKAPLNVSGAQSWSYDPTSNILTIKTKGTAQITATFTATTTSSTTTTKTTPPNTPTIPKSPHPDDHKPDKDAKDKHDDDDHEDNGKHKGWYKDKDKDDKKDDNKHKDKH